MTATRPAPEVTPVSAPYWEALADDVLRFQACADCGEHWLPPRPQCWRCLGDHWHWMNASGRATLVSWVVYHTVYHPAFEDLVPYTVAVVQLDEGPRLIAGLVGTQGPLAIGRQLDLVVQHHDGLHYPAFRGVA